ncbi:hypothetical protein, partial [Xylophilus sp. ASV27]|uniref:hypothetical protein n=1 Tax=Xylophilus sp. ASV27 TaxID=2795129 RepID=UPI001E3710AD
ALARSLGRQIQAQVGLFHRVDCPRALALISTSRRDLRRHSLAAGLLVMRIRAVTLHIQSN